MYFAYAQAAMQQSSSILSNRRHITLAVRATTNPAGLAEAAQREIQSIDRDQPVTGVRTLDEAVARSVMPQRFNTSLAAILAGFALLLAMIGVYGVMNFSVSGRVREIGIRMALGAQSADVVRMIVRQGMALVLFGVMLGLAASLALTRVLASLLYGVSVTDPLVFILIPALLCLVALLACYVPARRAARVDPTVALRYE